MVNRLIHTPFPGRMEWDGRRGRTGMARDRTKKNPIPTHTHTPPVQHTTTHTLYLTDRHSPSPPCGWWSGVRGTGGISGDRIWRDSLLPPPPTCRPAFARCFLAPLSLSLSSLSSLSTTYLPVLGQQFSRHTCLSILCSTHPSSVLHICALFTHAAHLPACSPVPMFQEWKEDSGRGCLPCLDTARPATLPYLFLLWLPPPPTYPTHTSFRRLPCCTFCLSSPLKLHLRHLLPPPHFFSSVPFLAYSLCHISTADSFGERLEEDGLLVLGHAFSLPPVSVHVQPSLSCSHPSISGLTSYGTWSYSVPQPLLCLPPTRHFPSALPPPSLPYGLCLPTSGSPTYSLPQLL